MRESEKSSTWTIWVGALVIFQVVLCYAAFDDGQPDYLIVWGTALLIIACFLSILKSRARGREVSPEKAEARRLVREKRKKRLAKKQALST